MNAHVELDATQGDASYVRIQDLTFDYGGEKPAVDRLTLTIRKGEFLGLLGPSGCGKSTTLRMFSGLITPTAGTMQVGGADLVSRPPWKRNLGLVFQSYALFPHMNVNQNVAFGLKLRKLGRSEIETRVREALRIVRLEAFGNRKPAQLSGGQQQRVAIARAIVTEPDILLLDEPLSNLDARLRDEMRTELRDIQARTGITTLFVTHDQQEALSMCDRIAIMNNGRLEQVGTPSEIFDAPQTRFVADFIGRANMLDAEGTGQGLMRGSARLPCNGQVTPGKSYSLMVRPHAVTLCEPGSSAATLTGTVHRRTYSGSVIDVELALEDGGTLTAEVRPGSASDQLAEPGHRVACSWASHEARLFAS